MKTIVCEKPYDFQKTNERKVPSRRKEEATVAIKRVGICGTDIHAFQGNQPFFSYPRILGHELSGEIVEIEDSHSLNIGDRVVVIPYLHCGKCGACNVGKTNCCEHMQVLGVHTDGGMREKLNVPITNLIKVNDLSYDHSALIEPLAIGAHAINRAEVKAGDDVLVIGSGPIGLGVMLFAKEKEANVIALDTNQSRLDYCQKWLDLEHTIQASEVAEAEIKKACGGRLPQIVLDATGNASSMMKSFDYVGHGGTLVYVGLVKQNIQFHDPDFHQKEITLKASRNATRENFKEVASMLQHTQIDLNAYITHTALFDEAIDSFQEWLKPEANVIKAMIHV